MESKIRSEYYRTNKHIKDVTTNTLRQHINETFMMWDKQYKDKTEGGQRYYMMWMD